MASDPDPSKRTQPGARRPPPNLRYCYHAWVSLKVKAQAVGQTLYAIRADLFREYLRAELRPPRIPAYYPT